MALDEQLRQLAERVPAPPPGDATTAFRRGQRRRKRKQVLAGGAAAVVIAGVVVGANALSSSVPRMPDVADQPGQSESDNDALQDGWTMLRAGDLHLAVPSDWEVHDVEPAAEPSAQAGPCAYDLYGGIERLGEELTSPLAVVYPMESTGICRVIGLPDSPPEQPSIVLYAGVRMPGSDATRPNEGVPESLGTVPMLRVDSEAHEHVVEYRRAGARGGLLVSHLDDPIVQQVLATLRATDQGAQPNGERAADARLGSPDDWPVITEPPVLTTFATSPLVGSRRLGR